MNEPTPPPESSGGTDSSGGTGWGRLDGEEESDTGRPAEQNFANMGYGSISSALTIAFGIIVGVFLLAWGIVWINGNSPYGYYPLIVGVLALLLAAYLVVRRMRRRRKAAA